MRLIYYKSAIPNFGDDLNALIWPTLAPDLFARDDDEGFVGFGTIVGMPIRDPPGRLNVFSSGVGNDPLDGWNGRPVRFWCVRGPLSALALGLDPALAIADGAILTPLAPNFPARGSKRSGTVVVPHWTSLGAPGWTQAVAQCGLELLDPRAPPRDVVARIASAQLVLTESLHGAILAEAYDVPWHAFSVSGNLNVAKWLDWSLSLGRCLDITIVPPPDPRLALAHGRPRGASMTKLRFGAADIASQIAARSGSRAQRPRTLRQTARQVAANLPLAGRALGYTPARTAEGLASLALQEPALPSLRVIERLQQQLADRLRDLRKQSP